MSLKKNNFIYFEEIISSRIGIRELSSNDVDEVYYLFSNPEVTKYLAIETFRDREEATKLIDRAISHYKNNNIFYLGITLNENNKVIGYIGLSRFDLSPTTCQVVYALNQLYWNQGIMVEALRLFIDYLFSKQNKQIIVATHIAENKNSGRVMEKAGMQKDPSYDTMMVIKGKEEKLIGYSIKRSNL